MQVVCPRCDAPPAPEASAGSCCGACGATLQLELAVVDLGERTGTPPAAPRPASSAPAPMPEPLATLAPPTEDAPIELDADWQREKAARREAGSSAPRVARDPAARPAARSAPWLPILVVVAALGAGGYYLATRRTAPAPTQPATEPKPATPSTTVPRRGITIRIVGARGTPVTIDGAAAGKTPLSLERARGTRPIVIRAGGRTFELVPDRDQTIDLSAAPK